MSEKIKNYWEKTKEVLGKVSKKVWGALAVVLVIVIAAIVIVVSSNNEYEVLFADLNSGDVTDIVSYLEGQGITEYRLENGDTIKVPKGQVQSLQMRIIMEGYGTSGFAYEYYTENVGALSTQSEREKAWQISVEQKLRACIITLENVRDAQVNLEPGEDNTYVLDSKNRIEASASVIVTMKDGKMLTDKQATAIRALVAGGVKGLEVDFVTVLDTMGNTYTAGSGLDNASSDSSALKLQLEEKYNNLTRTNIMQVLTPIFGMNNVKVSVNCTVDVNRTTQASTEINAPEWSNNGEGIIGSKVWDEYIVRNEGENAGGEVGTESNSEIPEYVEGQMKPDGTETEIGSSGQIDYVNPTTETYTERTAGYLTDCMVSVSINTASMSAEDIENLKLHIARAAGISDEYAASKISVYTALFYVEPVDQQPGGEQLADWMIFAIAGGVLLLILVLSIIISSANKKKRKKKEAEMLALMQQQALEQMMNSMPEEEELSADVMNMKNEKSMELRKDIRRFADESPEIAAQIVRSLLRGGDSDG